MRFVCLFFMLLLYSASTLSESRIKTVTIWTYYDFKPFFDEQTQRGLISDTAKLLTRYSKGHYHFVVEYLPRKRVDLKLDSPELGMVALVNPDWFPESLLSSAPLLTGYDVLVSPAASPIRELLESESTQRSFIGVTGHQYPMIKSELKSGEIVRLDTSSVPNLMNLIARQRGDFTIVPGLVAHHYQSYSEFSHSLHFEPIFSQGYTRRMLFNQKHASLKSDIDEIFRQPEVIRQWKLILQRYSLTKLAAF